MTRSLEDAMKAAAGEMASARSPEKAKLVTEEQMMAAGLSDRQPPDYNEGLARYEDLPPQYRVQNEPLPAAPAAESTPTFVQSPPPAQQPVGNIQFAPSPPPQSHDLVGALLQQQQQLMEENRHLRDQLMQLMQTLQGGGNGQAPAAPRVRRASEMTDAQKEQVEYSGRGLLG